MAGLVSANPVARDTRNRAPVFGTRIPTPLATHERSLTTREVAENTEDQRG